MRRVISALRVLLVLVMACLAAGFPSGGGDAHAQGAASTVLDVRLGDHGDKTRYVLEMTSPLDFRIFAQSDPYRLVIDFPPLDWRAGGAEGSGRGLVSRHFYSLSAGGAGRIVLELQAPARVREAFFLPPSGSSPYRFVVDLEATDTDTFAGQIYTPAGAVVPDDGTETVATSTALRPPLPAPAPVSRAPAPPQPQALLQPAAAMIPFPAIPLPRQRPERAPVRLIAIDPGHGGIDPGAISVNGIQEKDITLEMARELRAVLEETGRYRVFMTRDSDIYLKLRERVALAREAGADLFLSVHADSIGDPSIRGASVYTLSDVASDREAAMLAARENRADALSGVELDPEDDVMASILIDLAQRLSQNESKALAERLVDSMGEETQMLGNAHRQAGFAVLKAPDVPSVLMELGYLSNEADEGRLRSEGYRRRLAQSIAEAIDDYFGWLDGGGRI
ncbi:MAG TPA: N-acetylmuramoyl-L-alanine amidase [Alphaproteobacteria bacterium]|nr:N-acetylmuramoyl-L-alanine amidase [Alphaproteobacteria bacterium]